ncbi:MAG TPA: Wzz/FepE/Etk N-terminal domain-containing protein [Edaphobacter sp.]|nr:Wzz/FepE/Etk N-terminal domain-containing protein [Edaphobacter sp.]
MAFSFAIHSFAAQCSAHSSAFLSAAWEGKTMIPNSVLSTLELDEAVQSGHESTWAIRALLLWRHRRVLARVTAISLLVSLAISFAIPRQYKSTTSIMPPDQQGSTAMLLAALTGHSGGLGALGGLASGLLGAHSSTALFINLLQSGTVSGHLIDRFNLQHVYHKRYRIDTAKHLARSTKITEDKKSGVITIAVEDRSRVRARDLAQAYLDELNKLVTRTNTSAAHQERIFVERRLNEVQVNLEDAEMKLSQFSSKSSAIDIKEQTRAMVDAGARVQAELLVEQSGLQSLRQIYGDGNVRVRETEARIASLKGELTEMTGSSAPLTAEAIHDDNTNSVGSNDKGELYPPLRQLPRLAVPYADLYRRVKVQEGVFELLTQQYEMARIEEAKDVPVVSVIDPPGIPEKKSFPPHLLITLLLTFLSFAGTSALILVRDHWEKVDPADPRKMLATEILPVLRRRIRLIRLKRGVE